MRVTSKGQVTIPKEIREQLGIQPGSEVEFVNDNDGEVKLRLLPSVDRDVEPAESIRKWTARVAGTLDLGGMTADEYFESIRGERDDLGSR
ncbi:AbrB/MazE/SpoVT family DNA-binding domain-containing protein [Aquibium sp. LZ166]|uniref:AbrB/MazE/SpoVT family DNA-binding domain-containing protein n=1 Tax=Aquibium pacificus TaxID=3153579 RepID=A0ABV3SHJ9_9HYPH